MAAAIEVINSGSEVPIAIKDKPINESGIFKISEILTADPTAVLTPNSNIIIEIVIMGKPKNKGFFADNQLKALILMQSWTH